MATAKGAATPVTAPGSANILLGLLTKDGPLEV